MMSISRVLLFSEVAEAGSLTSAARARFLSPSAVSQQIQKLESEAGQSLLRRVPHGIELTEAGEMLLTHAVAISNQLAAANNDLRRLRTLQTGAVTLASFPSASATLLPSVLTRFKRAFPHPRLSVESALRPTLIKRLLRHEVDLGLLWEYPWNRLRLPQLTLTHLLDDPAIYLVSSEHRFANRGQLRLAELASEEWIVRGGGHAAGQLLREAARGPGFTPNVTFEAHDYQETQAMVGAGLGIAMLPRLGLAVTHENVRIVLPDPSDRLPARRIYVAHPASAPPSSAAQMLYQTIFDALVPTVTWLLKKDNAIRGIIPT